MAEHKRNVKADRRYLKNKYDDAPIAPDIQKSVTDLRAVYSSFTDIEFAAWYRNRYSVSVPAVMRVLDENKVGGGCNRHIDTGQR